MALDVDKCMNSAYTRILAIVLRDHKSPNLLVDKNLTVKVSTKANRRSRWKKPAAALQVKVVPTTFHRRRNLKAISLKNEKERDLFWTRVIYLQISLKEGVGTLGGEVTFTDNSSWIRSRKFRLGLKVASGFCRVREAKTEAFTVKDHRGEYASAAHYPPALRDGIWRLEKIGKDGSFHERLNKAGIFIVEDFLQLVVKDSQRLRNILGSGMSTKMWESLAEHAKTGSGKHYIYHSDETRSVAAAVFNNIY